MSETGSLLAAMLAVQAEAPTLTKDATNPHFKSKYAALDTIVETIRPLLAQNGLVWTTKPSYMDGVGPSLKYKLAHAPSNESDEGEMLLLLGKNDPQGQGSAITYARRYALVSVLNLVADDDDDGNGASSGSYGQAKPKTQFGLASDKQVALVRSLLTKNKVTQGEAKKLLAAAGVDVGDGESARDACARIPRSAVSEFIDLLNRGALPTGESDVPGAGADDFKHEPGDDREPVPFDPGVPS